MEMMGKGSGECHKLSCCLCVCSWIECWTCFCAAALPPFCRAERGSTGVRMAGSSFTGVVPTVRKGCGFAWVLPTALVCVRGKFFFCLTTKQGNVCFPCDTGNLLLISKGNQFAWFFVSCSDPGIIVPEHFLPARRAGNTTEFKTIIMKTKCLFITAHHGK